jgi:hypothetical protein
MIRLRWLLLPSSVLAVCSLLAFPVAALLKHFDWFDMALRLGFWCGVTTFFLLIVGAVTHRFKGLWLLIPMLLAFVSPAYVVVSVFQSGP